MIGSGGWIERLIPSRYFVKSVAILAGGAGVGQAIVVLATPVLTRLYTPANFGVLAVFAGMLGIIMVMSSLAYERALPLPDDDAVAANLLCACFVTLAVISGLTAVLVWLLGDQIADLTNAQELKRYLWLLPIGVVMAGAFQVLNYWSVRRKKYASIASGKLGQGLGVVLIQLGLGVLNIKPLGLLLGQVVGHTVGSATLAVLSLRKDEKIFAHLSWSGLWRATERYRRFPIFLFPASLLTQMWMQLPVLIIAAFYDPHVVGWFSLAQLVISAPSVLVGTAVGQVYWGEAVALARETPDALQRLFNNTLARLFILGAVPLVIFVFGGSSLFEFVFGPEWVETGLYVQLLSAMFILRFVMTPISQVTFNILERQDLEFGLSIVRVVVTIGVLLIAGWLKIAPEQTVALYGASVVLTYAVNYFLLLHALRKSRNPGVVHCH